MPRPDDDPAIVSLAMYPFEHLRAGYERLWSCVVAELPGWPQQLEWGLDPAAACDSRDMIVALTCAWPLVTKLRDRVRVVGSFGYDVESADGFRYRSTLVAARPGAVEDFGRATVAVNDAASLSGWVSLRSSGVRVGDVVWTGSHHESVRAVRGGRAELAAIDPVSLAHIGAAEPELVARLHRIGRGPLVPTLPLVTRRDVSDDELGSLRAALTRHTPNAAVELRLTEFHPLDLDAYEAVADLDPELFAEQGHHSAGK